MPKIKRFNPVEDEPRYSQEALAGLDNLVEQEKGRGKAVRPGKKISKYPRQIGRLSGLSS